MSLGSRFANRGKAAVIASISSTPREPLLFLYPQWIRNSSSTSSTVPNQAHSSLQSDTGTIPTDTDKPSIPHEQVTKSSNNDVEGDARRRQEVAIAGTEGKHTELAQSRKAKSQLMNGGDSPPTSKIRKIIHRQQKSRISVEHKQGVRNEYQSRIRAEKNQDWVPDWREVLADLSSNTTKTERWLETALHISIPRSAVAQLLSGVDDNLWDIAGRYDCSVYLSDEDPIPEHRNVLLSGGATAISRTVADILQIAPQAKVKVRKNFDLASLEKNTSDVGDDGFRYSRDGKARKTVSEHRSVVPITRADKIPRPSEWTQQSFADYVRRLTSSKGPNHLHRLMYKKGDHVSTVIGILREIFQDPECRTSLSRAAFNMAIQYFITAHQMLDARMFFVQMEMHNIPMNDRTFNALLRGAAKNDDLQNYHFILHLMLRRRIKPNAGTWIAFLMAVPDLRIKLHIFKRMNDMGLLRHVGTMRAACEQIVTLEISASLDNAQTQAEFLSHMDSRYGPSWLTIDCSNRIINALAARGLISRSWAFLHAMDSRFVKPNEVSINIILNHCKQSGNISGALQLMKSLPLSFGFVPGEITYRVLFEMAWRGKNYNLARVVWRYACLNATTTHSMRLRMLTSLKAAMRKVHEPGQSPRQYFGHTAGLFISAFEHLRNHPTAVYSREFKNIMGFDMIVSGPEVKSIQSLAEIGDGTDQNESMSLLEVGGVQDLRNYELSPVELEASTVIPPYITGRPTSFPHPLDQGYRLFLRRESEIFQTWQPVRPFADMLIEAREMDLEWINPQDYEKREEMAKLGWKLENAIAIPIKAEINSERIEMLWK
jgi:pentatricopeptide repeat protein